MEEIIDTHHSSEIHIAMSVTTYSHTREEVPLPISAQICTRNPYSACILLKDERMKKTGFQWQVSRSRYQKEITVVYHTYIDGTWRRIVRDKYERIKGLNLKEDWDPFEVWECLYDNVIMGVSIYYPQGNLDRAASLWHLWIRNPAF